MTTVAVIALILIGINALLFFLAGLYLVGRSEGKEGGAQFRAGFMLIPVLLLLIVFLDAAGVF